MIKQNLSNGFLLFSQSNTKAFLFILIFVLGSWISKAAKIHGEWFAVMFYLLLFIKKKLYFGSRIISFEIFGSY